MLAFSNVTAPDADSPTFRQGPAILAPTLANGSFFTFGWCPTARPAENSSGARGSKVDISLRTANTIFARGTKEIITLSTQSSHPWQWRRICFQIKAFFDTPDPNTSSFFRLTSSGMVRLITLIPNEGIFTPLFEGSRDRDWEDPMIAPLNRDLITVKYDRRTTIKSGNDTGTIKVMKHWHPINANITYRDEQEGENMDLSPISTAGKKGSGDYYIIDIFKPGPGYGDDDILSFDVNSTFYWHEK